MPQPATPPATPTPDPVDKTSSGKVIKEIYVPLGTADFSPYLTVIRSLDPKVVYDFSPGGADSTRFVQQYAESGIKARLTCYGGMVDETTVAAIGKAALGVISSTIYTDTLDTPENRRFVAEYRAKSKEYPNLFSDYGVVVAEVDPDGAAEFEQPTPAHNKR